MRRAEKSLHLVKAARALFNQYGYHAVGVDQIIADAGIAKTTLYRHFRSKEDLIVAVLKLIDEETRAAMRHTAQAAEGTSPLLATFDFLEGWFNAPDYFGCPFMGAAKEYCDEQSAVHQQAALHKRLTVAYFEKLARSERYRQPKSLAEQINLLHEGAISVAQITGDSTAARTAKDIANRLLNTYEKVASRRRARPRSN